MHLVGKHHHPRLDHHHWKEGFLRMPLVSEHHISRLGHHHRNQCFLWMHFASKHRHPSLRYINNFDKLLPLLLRQVDRRLLNLFKSTLAPRSQPIYNKLHINYNGNHLLQVITLIPPLHKCTPLRSNNTLVLTCMHACTNCMHQIIVAVHNSWTGLYNNVRPD